MLSAIHPGKKDPGTWIYGTRVLALMPQNYELPEGAVVAPSTKRGVAMAVGRFAHYPTGMMFGDPELAIRLLAERGGHLLLRTSGAFYGGNTEADAGADEGHRHLDL